MRRRAAALVLLLLVAAVGAGCGADSTASEIGDRPVRVVATTNFIADTAREVGGDRVEVEPLMGPGVDPHLYKASASDVGVLRRADVVLYGGLQLEGKLEEILTRLETATPVTRDLPRERLLAASAAGAAAGEEVDPHVWFDPALWRVVVGTVRDTLAERDPRHAGVYRRNARRYARELARLEREARAAVASIPERRRLLVTSHDAFAYFGRAFGIDVAAIQGISTAAEATTADVRRVAELIAERRVPAVFVESSVPRQTIEAVLAAARERGQEARVAQELFSDAAGAPGTPEGTYAGMVRANVERIVAGLRGGRAGQT